MKVRSQQDLGTGLIFLAVAGFFIWQGMGLRRGTAVAMGPGFFPLALSILLATIGAAVVVKAFLRSAPQITRINVKPLVIVTFATAGYGFLLPTLGFPIATALLTLVIATASVRFRLGWWPLAGVVLLVAFSTAVFLFGLRIPMPMWGSWLPG